MDKSIIKIEKTLGEKLRILELKFYRRISNYIEKRRSSYYNNDKYHFGTSVRTNKYIDSSRQWGPDHKDVPGFDAL